MTPEIFIVLFTRSLKRAIIKSTRDLKSYKIYRFERPISAWESLQILAIKNRIDLLKLVALISLVFE